MARQRQLGISEAGECARSFNGKATREYALWNALLQRCYDESFQKKAPTYAFCSVSDSFLRFQEFAGWCKGQVGYAEGGHLDKDLLVVGNTHYSEANCVFLPRAINALFIAAGASRGTCPVGVSFHKPNGKYRAQLSLGSGRVTTLGYFDTPEAAFQCYKVSKEALIKQRAEEYRDVLDARAYNALVQYEISIDD
jgi:hypothetical protein